jgi:Tfp pilus assembly protein PilE
MTVRILSRQRGVSFVSLLLVALIVGVGGVLAARIIPSALEYQAVVKAVDKAAAEALNVDEARAIFDRAAAVNDIASLKGRDLEVTRGAGEKPTIRFAYQREFHLAGPAFLTLKYSGQSGGPAAAAGAKSP